MVVGPGPISVTALVYSRPARTAAKAPWNTAWKANAAGAACPMVEGRKSHHTGRYAGAAARPTASMASRAGSRQRCTSTV